MGNTADWIVCAFAITGLGATAVAFNTWVTTPELEHLLKHSDVRYVFAAQRLLKNDYVAMLEQLSPWAERFPHLQGIIALDGHTPEGWIDFPRVVGDLDETQLDAIFAAVSPDDIAIMLYTSGSTSLPKGVQLQHRPLIENTWHIGERQRVTCSDRLWLAISLFWGYGCSNAMVNLLSHGGCIVLQESFDASEALRLIETERCSIFYGTSNMAHAMFEHPDRAQHDLSSLRSGAITGRPVQIERVMALGVHEVCNIYGLSEVYGNSHVTDVDDPLEKRLTSSGRPLPGVTQKVVAPDGSMLAPGEVGELCLKGRVTPGYYKDPEQTAAAFDADGYFRTGDLVTVDEQGFMSFRGRLKEILKPGGINVSPAEVEGFLIDLPGVRAAYVVGIQDALRGETLAAVLVPDGAVALSTDEIIQRCRESLSGYKVPRQVRYVREEQLPLTSTGKVFKNGLANAFFGPRV